MPPRKHSGHALQDRAAFLPRRPIGVPTRIRYAYESTWQGLNDGACAKRGRVFGLAPRLALADVMGIRNSAPAKDREVAPTGSGSLRAIPVWPGQGCLCLTRELPASPPQLWMCVIGRGSRLPRGPDLSCTNPLPHPTCTVDMRGNSTRIHHRTDARGSRRFDLAPIAGSARSSRCTTGPNRANFPPHTCPSKAIDRPPTPPSPRASAGAFPLRGRS